MPVIDELIAVLGYRLEGEADRAKFQRGLDDLTRGFDDFAAKAANFAAIAAGAVAAGMGALAKSVIGVSAQFEDFESTLTTIEGSAERAVQSLGWLKDFSVKTPYEIQELTDAFVRLKSYGLDPVADGMMEVLGDTASAMGAGLSEAVEAFADAGTMEFERLKRFGVTTEQMGDQVAFTWSRNGEQLTRVVKKSGNEIRKFLLENFGERFGGAMEERNRNFNNIIANLADAWTFFKLKIGDSGFFDAVVERVTAFRDAVERLDDNGTLDRWAERISDAFVWVLDKTESTVRRFKGHFDTLAQLYESNRASIERWKEAIWAALAFLAWRMAPVWISAGLIATAIEDILSHLAGGESYFGDFVTWLQEVLPVSEPVAENIAAISAAFGAFVLLAGPITTLNVALRGLAGALTALGAGGALAAGAKLLGKVGPWAAAFGIIDPTEIGVDPVEQSGGNQGFLDQTKLPETKGAGSVGMERARQTNPGPLSMWTPDNLANLQANLARIEGSTRSPHPMTDNRNQSVTVHSTVNQTVRNASDAPAAAAQATDRAVSKSATGAAPARIMQEGAQ
ncbi:MAG: hypothetical protein CL812_09825 [Confluentimicrobium sp.]|nr:hypothetical protein [Actibacterium sp.]|tara:strand:+ start:1486 stop:3186 length:1701 start_codon:yes stop_codon:yes gene_type:complete